MFAIKNNCIKAVKLTCVDSQVWFTIAFSKAHYQIESGFGQFNIFFLCLEVNFKLEVRTPNLSSKLEAVWLLSCKKSRTIQRVRAGVVFF